MTKPTSEAASSTGQGAALFADLINGYARFWTQFATNAGRAVTGTYTVPEAVSDFEAWLSSSTTFALKLAENCWGVSEPFVASPGIWSAEMTVLPSVTQRPLILRAEPLRAIGLGSQLPLPASAVTFSPPEVVGNTFRVNVTFPPGPQGQTLIYEGFITAEGVEGPVTDPIRPNNRDGGPLQ